MKKLSLLLMLGTALTPWSVNAADCIATPDCAELGFTADASKCEGAALKCPWDTSKAACKETGECGVENCATCVAGRSDSCAVCKDGYSLIKFVEGQYNCFLAINTCKVINCSACVSGDTTVCKTCEDGYTLTTSGGCEKSSTEDDTLTRCKLNYTVYKRIAEDLKTAILRSTCKMYTSWSLIAPIKLGETCTQFNTRIKQEIEAHNASCGAEYKVEVTATARCDICCDLNSYGMDGSFYLCEDNGDDDPRTSLAN